MTLDTDIAKAGAPEPPAPFELPRSFRILLLGKDSTPAGWVDAIKAAGHATLVQSPSMDHALDIAARRVVDVVILTLPFEEVDVVHFCSRLQAVAALPVLLVGDRVNPALIDQALELGICGVLPLSADGTSLTTALAVGARWLGSHRQLQAQCQRLAEENRQLATTLQNRKLIERAKGVYMRVLGLQEAEAHRRLQQESQKRRLSLAELARKIIESDELLGG